ncbi:histidine kinase [Hymenobacter sp. BT664]|uniref:Histidine kinase n=1 Tax=Hymenobacter montanus TaxID=2771359 RepID=A0A927BFU0_9BACT|nr:histidine kinase [Hymenobacter montanus]MBD2769485.1 histidine kinase [Hymenobacter montanus]
MYPLAKFAGHADHKFNYWLSALQTATSVLPVYGFYLLALPRLFAAKQYAGLGLGGLGLAALFAGLDCYLSHAFLTDCPCSLQLCVLNTTPEKASLLLFFSAVFAFKQHHWKQKELEHTEKERLGAELGYLKAQVNPHYLFNTLNTIYSCSLDNPVKVPGLLLKLSHNLRYVLYDSERDRVDLAQEIQHLDDYISLQQLRLEGRVRVDFSVEGVVAGQTITPLLLVAFVENTFKHCAEYLDRESEITVRIAVAGPKLHFWCENDCTEPEAVETSPCPPAEGGLGLKNVCKRLELAYGPRQRLMTAKVMGKFQAELIIDPL